MSNKHKLVLYVDRDLVEKSRSARFKPKQILSREQLVQFYRCLETAKEKALFMLYATTGLRRDEILSLKPEDDRSIGLLTPQIHMDFLISNSKERIIINLRRT